MNRASSPPALPDLDRDRLSAFNRHGKLKLLLTRLGQHRAADGRLTLTGKLGALRVVVRQGDPDEAGSVLWDVHLAEH